MYTQTFFLTPAECSPESRMPLTLLINRLIEVATLHANQIGIGYAYLLPSRRSWVLSRVAVEMERWPGVNDHYSVSTWISSLNRLFSERDFVIRDTMAGDAPIGWARTVWAVIDMDTRQGRDIQDIQWAASLAEADVAVPVAKPSRPVAVAPGAGEARGADYRFTYCDLDFNRHVNSSRYIELILNQWPLEWHDAHALRRFEIAYLRQAYYAQQVRVSLSAPGADGAVATQLTLQPGGEALCRAKVHFC